MTIVSFWSWVLNRFPMVFHLLPDVATHVPSQAIGETEKPKLPENLVGHSHPTEYNQMSHLGAFFFR